MKNCQRHQCLPADCAERVPGQSIVPLPGTMVRAIWLFDASFLRRVVDVRLGRVSLLALAAAASGESVETTTGLNPA